jgi:phosphoserine aminotransferase
VEEIHKINKQKAKLLYDELDRNKVFQPAVENEEDRSIMNVTFVMEPEYADKEVDFRDFSASKGMVGIKGHRSVGGFRASIYNALPIESVKALVDTMKEFEAKL